MKMKIKLLIFSLIVFSANATNYSVKIDTSKNVFYSETKHGDTLTKRNIYEIDEHLVICDTILIEKKKQVVKTIETEKPNRKGLFISIFALTFAVLAIILKRKNNG